MKRGVLLFNLGGPVVLQDVRPFLKNLFSDPDILVGMNPVSRKALANFISIVKGPSSKKMYAQIGKGSPQLKWTRQQADLLEEQLSGGKDEVRVEVAMRAWNPTIEMAIVKLRSWGAEELTLFPLFPQFSTTTTGSCFKEAERILKKLKWDVPLRRIQNWPDYPPYIELIQRTIDEKLEEIAAVDPKLVHILFSAHSLPMKIIERGDTYPEDVQRTVRLLTPGLQYSWSLAFQSRNGPIPWLKPYTETEIERLAHEGKKYLLIVPLSFVSDHIETLFEVDLLYTDLAKKSGFSWVGRTRSFNDDSDFIQTLGRLYQEGPSA